MNATVAEPVHVTEEEDVDSISVPGKEEFAPCDSCGHRSYLHYVVGKSLLSYCGHHGSKYEEKLKLAGTVVADYRESLQGEKRTQGQP